MLDRGSVPGGAKPTIGGWLPPVLLTDQQTAVLNAVADQLVPGGDGFPAPSATGVLSFVTRYVVPAGQQVRWYPFVGEERFKRHLDELGRGFLDSAPDEQVEALRRWESEVPDFFAGLRDLVFHAYYSQPEVVRAINRELAAGRDYRGTPQPYGYSDVLAGWDDELLGRVRGSYTPTEAVTRLPAPGDPAVGT